MLIVIAAPTLFSLIFGALTKRKWFIPIGVLLFFLLFGAGFYFTPP